MPAVLAAGLGPMYLGRFWSVIHAMSMPSPRQPSGKDHWNHWSPYNLTLLQLEQTTGSSGQRGTYFSDTLFSCFDIVQLL